MPVHRPNPAHPVVAASDAHDLWPTYLALLMHTHGIKEFVIDEALLAQFEAIPPGHKPTLCIGEVKKVLTIRLLPLDEARARMQGETRAN